MGKMFEINSRQFQMMMDGIVDLVMVIEVVDGSDFVYRFMNKKAQEIIGVREDVFGKTFADIFPDQKATYIQGNFLKVLQHKEPVTFERYESNGWIGQTTLTPIFDDDGHVEYIFSVTQDLKENNKMKEAITQKTNELELVWNYTSDAIFIMKEDGSIYKVNPAFEEMLGWTEEEISKEPIPPIFWGHNQAKHEAFLRRLFSGENFNNIERKRVCKNGKIIDVLASYRPIILEEKNYAVAMYKEVTNIQVVQQKLRESEEQFKSLFVHNPDLIVATDQNGNITNVNSAVQTVLGYTEEDITDDFINVLMGYKEDQIKERIRYVNKTLQGETQAYELSVYNKKGNRVDLKIKSIPIKKNGEIKGVYEVGQDITLQKQAEEKLKKLALCDTLTDLPNRRAINEEIDAALIEASQNNHSLALLYIDLDHFKEINDSKGHLIGDELLVQFSLKVKDIVSEKNIIARLGGDEFLILMPKVDHSTGPKALAKSIIQSLQEPMTIAGHEIQTTLSIGIAMYPDHGVQKRELLMQADEALYMAKNDGKNTFKIIESNA
ncbi:PAS domain S-box protein [Halalkalibacter nanhaiisediminis]|uniref:PAS domain S-box-containing protein/diguanylate cyclase (GGDEF)-like protein n=1 Tax=Halalkalibacter nanhaiisediminis TaxID=688079 RepID=A0A562QUD2_9BACI|nr:PAS domain S-box protein [Halalkalibacter nanhaiisediminis]TWI59850.1 PAS domain S-box-containing protein/diguanylate cyclase (GGDEF)-like protein [Halalkalibacter nanhaiisediminis]